MSGRILDLPSLKGDIQLVFTKQGVAALIEHVQVSRSLDEYIDRSNAA